MKTYLIILIDILISLTIIGQNENRIWYFGGDKFNQMSFGTGIDFNSGSPVVLNNSKMGYTEGSAIQCDRNGNLLFYTNGMSVWDKTHNLMPNGSGLGGDESSEQSALIIPFPNDTSKYYLFANAGFPTAGGAGLFYSVIDMTLNNGNGSVTATKAIPMLSGTSEWLSGTWHSNGTDYWVVTAKFDSSIFYSYRISASGISLPIKTNLGYNNNAYFKLDFNTKGDKITFNSFNGQSWPNGPYFRRIANFNQTSGLISNPVYIDSLVGNNGACFSPDDNLLYYYGNNGTIRGLYQVDLNSANISASKQTIKLLSVSSGYYTDMKLGPDNKIYGNKGIGDSLDRINSPNIFGVGCNYQVNAIYLNGIESGYVLPNKTFGRNLLSVGVLNNTLDQSLIVSPNPSNGSLIIHTNKSYNNYIIYDSYGNKVFENKFDKTLEFENINLDINSGIYFLLVYDNAGRCYKRKIIME